MFTSQQEIIATLKTDRKGGEIKKLEEGKRKTTVRGLEFW
jgi:hypothetical protein